MPEKLYRNKETGEVIKWTGTGKPTTDQLRAISLRRKADLEQKKMDIRSDVQKQTPPAFNISELPQDIYQTGKQYLENLGSAVTFPFEGLYSLRHGPYSPEFQKFVAPIVQRPESAVPIVGPSLSLARTGFTPEGVRSALTGAAAGLTAIAPFVPEAPSTIFKSPTEVISRAGANLAPERALPSRTIDIEPTRTSLPLRTQPLLPAKIEPPKVPPIIPPETPSPTPAPQVGAAPEVITSRPEPGVIQPQPIIRPRRVTGPVSGPGEVPFRPVIGEPQQITFPATRPLALEVSPIEPYLGVPELREMLSQREIPRGGRKPPAIFERGRFPEAEPEKVRVSLPEEIKKPTIPETIPKASEPEESIVSAKAQEVPKVNLEELEPGPKERTIEGHKVKVLPPAESELPEELRMRYKEPRVTLPTEELPSESEAARLGRRKLLEQRVEARKPKTQSQIDLEEIEKVVGKSKKKVPTLDELVKGEEGKLDVERIKEILSKINPEINQALDWIKSKFPKFLNIIDNIVFNQDSPTLYSPQENLVSIQPSSEFVENLPGGGTVPIRLPKNSNELIIDLIHELEHARQYNKFARSRGLDPKNPDVHEAWIKNIGYADELTEEEYKVQFAEQKPVRLEEAANRRLLREQFNIPKISELLRREEGSLNLPNLFNWAKAKQQIRDKVYRGEQLTSDEEAIQSQEKLSESKRGISPFRYNITSSNQSLKSRPETAPIARMGELAVDAGDMFVAQILRAADKALRIPYKTRLESREILDNFDDPRQATGYSDAAVQSAIRQRELFNAAIRLAQEAGTQTGLKVNRLSGYITHLVESAAGNSEISKSINEIWSDAIREPFQDISDWIRGPKKPQLEGGSPRIYSRGTPRPTSPFVKHRSGLITVLEKDPRRIWPAYAQSIRKVIFNRPAVERISDVIRTLEGSDKEIATQYARQLAGYTNDPFTTHLWTRVMRMLTRTAGRAVLGLSPELQELHLSRIGSNIYPVLPTKYFALGVYDFLRNPVKVIEETQNLGLTQLVPFRMLRPTQKFDALLNYMNIGNNMARYLSISGFIRQAFDEGVSQPVLTAIGRLKDADQNIDAARAIPIFHPKTSTESIFSTLLLQYKYIPAKMIEQGARILENWMSNPMAVARLVLGYYALYYLKKKYGLRVLHLSPSSLNIFSAPVERQYGRLVLGVEKAAKKQWIDGEDATEEWTKVGEYLLRFMPAAEQVRLGLPLTEEQRKEREEALMAQ